MGRVCAHIPKTTALCLLILLVGTTWGSLPARAQPLRSGDTFYLEFGAGLSDLAGDDDASPTPDTNGLVGDFFDVKKFRDGGAFPYVFATEVGYRVLPEVEVGLGYQFGRYPFASGLPLTTRNGLPGEGGDLGTARHTIQLVGRYMHRAERWVASPYVHMGVSGTFGGYQTALGPLAGLGVSVAVADRMSLFFETRLNFTFPDRAVNGIEGGEPFDVVSALPLIGVKHTF